MKPALARRFLDDLRLSRSSEIDLAPLRRLGRREWEQTLFWLTATGLAHYFFERVRALGSESALPPEVNERLARNLAENRLRVAAMAKEVDLLNRRFEEAGARFALLKGFTLIPDYCPDAPLRTWYYHEYLLSAESLQRAQSVLQAAGYSLKKTLPRGQYFYSTQPLTMPSAASVDDCYTSAFPRFVVLQLKLWDADHSRISLGVPEDVLSSARLRTWNGLRFPALTDEDTLIFLALDTFHHMLGYWCKLFWFFEIAYFLKQRSLDAGFWERFQERIKGRTHLTEVIGLVLSLAARLFRVEVPAAINARVIQSLPPALSLWVEQYGEDWALKEFPGSKLSLFIQRELVLDPAAWREVRRIRLIPLHKSSRVAEPSSPSLSSRVEAGRQQWTHVFRRIKFHTTTTSRYLWELPRWRRLLRRASAG